MNVRTQRETQKLNMHPPRFLSRSRGRIHVGHNGHHYLFLVMLAHDGLTASEGQTTTYQNLFQIEKKLKISPASESIGGLKSKTVPCSHIPLDLPLVPRKHHPTTRMGMVIPPNHSDGVFG